MTISTSSPARVIFNCDGVSKVFPAPIQAYLPTDFVVTLTAPIAAGGAELVLTLNSDYSLAPSGTLAPTAWTLTTLATAAFASGYSLQLYVAPPLQQQTQYVQGQAFPSLAVQTNLDRLTQMIQRVQDQVSRCIHTPDGDVSPLMQLPIASGRAGTGIVFDANGNAGVGLIPSTAFTQAIFNAFLLIAQLYLRTTQEAAASVTPADFRYPINDPRRSSYYENVGWTDFSDIPTFISSNSFSIPTDVTTRYAIGVRVAVMDASTRTYGRITASVFGSGITTITILVDSGNVPTVPISVWVQQMAVLHQQNAFWANVNRVMEHDFVNTSTGASAQSKITVANATDSGLGIYCTGANYTGSTVAGAPAGATTVIHTGFPVPIVFATTDTARMIIKKDGSNIEVNAAEVRINSSVGTRATFTANGTADGVYSLEVAGVQQGIFYSDATLVRLGSQRSIPLQFVTNGIARLQIPAVGLGNFANDAAAATGGVAVGEMYRNGSILMIRVA